MNEETKRYKPEEIDLIRRCLSQMGGSTIPSEAALIILQLQDRIDYLENRKAELEEWGAAQIGEALRANGDLIEQRDNLLERVAKLEWEIESSKLALTNYAQTKHDLVAALAREEKLIDQLRSKEDALQWQAACADATWEAHEHALLFMKERGIVEEYMSQRSEKLLAKGI